MKAFNELGNRAITDTFWLFVIFGISSVVGGLICILFCCVSSLLIESYKRYVTKGGATADWLWPRR